MTNTPLPNPSCPDRNFSRSPIMKIIKCLTIALISGGVVVASADDRGGNSSASAPAEPPTPPQSGPSTVPDFLLPFDTDEDGILSQEELGAARIALKERRVQKSVEWSARSPLEQAAAREAVRSELEAKRTKHFLDAAGEDSKLDLDEFLAIGAFAKLAEKSPERAAAIFTRLDSDRDGSISAPEFLGNLRPVRPARPKLKPEERERPEPKEARSR